MEIRTKTRLCSIDIFRLFCAVLISLLLGAAVRKLNNRYLNILIS